MVIVKALEKRKALKRLSVDDNKDGIIHDKVKNALNAYREMFTKLLEERGLKSNNRERVDIEVAMRLRDQKKCVNMAKRLGSIPGVEVGDEFHNRAELTIVGLHHCFQNGIDYVKKCGKILAVSIVNSGRYANRVESPDTLIYSGAGGNPCVDTAKPKDQILKRGNLALMNSMEHGNYVRVIRAVNRLEAGTLRKKNYFMAYVYDGLYTVEDCKRERGSYGKLVFKFCLKRIPGQPEISWGKVSGKLKKQTVAKNIVCKNDISQGKEKVPIRVVYCTVNATENESFPSFNYVCNVIYPPFFKATIQKGCDCPDGCLESCPCVMKNGGVLPYNNKRCLTNKKSVIHECGPLCTCSSACQNRVSQHGIQFKLEVFKTKSKGWGLRSRSYVPRRSFICEYIGEILQDENGFAISAAQHGNVGRFVSHSNSPNVFIQSVLYDHGNISMPHKMLFAEKDIPPKQELTYDYSSSVAKLNIRL